MVTHYFDITAGVLQGDTLTPFVFVKDYVLRKAAEDNNALGLTHYKTKSSTYPAIKLTHTEYAEDLAADHLTDAATLLHKIESTASEIGLYVNTKKRSN